MAISNEGYELKFLGKNYARLLTSLETTTVVVPITAMLQGVQDFMAQQMK